MTELIRPLVEADLQQVAALFSALLLGGRAEATPALVAYLRATLLDTPWRDDELPSLVAQSEDGAVIGLIGSNVRTLRHRDRPIRAVWCSHLMVDPARSKGPTGLLLLRRMLSGPQDLSVTDTANAPVQRMWEALGGRHDPLRSLRWMHVLRPARWLAGLGARELLCGRITSRTSPVAALPFHVAGARLAGRAFDSVDATVTSAPLTADDVLEHSGAVLRDAELRPAYDREQLDWLLAEMAATRTGGDLHARVVERDGRVLGWYASYVRPGGVSRVVAAVAGPRDTDAVVGDLFEHSRRCGAAVITGRVEPHVSDALLRRLSVIGAGDRVLVHSHDPALADAMLGVRALVSRMDGEWW
jgi:hypothetical protein